jgi:hypothetical protein
MKIYRLHKLTNNHESEGFAFFSNRKDADGALREYEKGFDRETESEVELLDFLPTKKEIIALLNRVAHHNDNG